jgi:hypothetical protein
MENTPQLLAQKLNINPYPYNSGTPMPTVGIQGPLAFSSIAELMNRLMLFLVPFAAVVLLVAFIWGGFDLLLSQGDPGKIKKGRMKITSSLIGFMLIIFAFIIVKAIAYIVGLKDSAGFIGG